MQSKGDAAPALLCPSAGDRGPEAFVFGVVEGSVDEPQVTYLRRALPLSVVRHLAVGVEPGEVFRTAAPCAEDGCVHFRENACSLATRLVEGLPPAETRLPHCQVRSHCRWWFQEGAAACMRCSQIVTDDYRPNEPKVMAAKAR